MGPAEVVGYLEKKKFLDLPLRIIDSSLVLHSKAILSTGGIFTDEKKCLEFSQGAWKEHSTFIENRYGHSAVSTKTATFVFGGCRGSGSSNSYEYLPKDSTTWLLGKTKIPGGFEYGFAIAVKSEQEIWLIGGSSNGHRILNFNVKDHTFHEMPYKLNVERWYHRGAFIPNTNKVTITGGYNDGFLDSTEVLDTEDGSVTMMASPMNSKRFHHGMGVITINGKDRLAVFGGYDGRNFLDSVELYNTQTEKWENTEIKLKEPKDGFSVLTIKLGDFLNCNGQLE